MIIQVGMPPQQYCLRWNNHKNNMLTVFDELLREEAFTDVTFVCEGGLSIKSHKMVLAACSSYFKALFEEIVDNNPILILKDVRFWEMRTILEYMYRGEVSVEQSQLSCLLKTAEMFKVKGLIDESNNTYNNNTKNKYSPTSDPHQNKYSDPQNPNKYSDPHDEINPISTSSPIGFEAAHSSGSNLRHHHHNQHHHHSRQSRNNSPNERTSSSSHRDKRENLESYERSDMINENTTTSSNGGGGGGGGGSGGGGGGGNSNHAIENCSPPHSTGIHQTFPKSMYHYNKPSERHSNRISNPGWPMVNPSSLPMMFAATQVGGSVGNYESVIHDAAEVAPQRRKKLSNFSTNNMNKDTPILRNVLGQGQADSSQPMSLVCHSAAPDIQDHLQSNGPMPSQEMAFIKGIKSENIPEDAHSPHMETSFMEDEINHQERMNKMMHSTSASPKSFYSDSRMGGVSSGIATYVPTQKPEWKRYKQYTRTDILSAIDSVKNGMSALQAAKKFGVPSRTLYDKVKKLGISTQRPFRRSSTGNNGAHFPYGLTGTGPGMIFGLGNEDEVTAQSMLEHGFLQHALEGKMKLDPGDRESLTAVSNIAPHGFLQQALELGERYKAESMTAHGNTSGTSSSPGPGDRSPSPNFLKYTRRAQSVSPEPANDEEDDYEDQVEDLSISRKPEPQQIAPPSPPSPPQQAQPSRVIMPPMNQATATVLLNSCTVDNSRD